MTISEYIVFLEEMIEKYGDISIDVDLEAHDHALANSLPLGELIDEDDMGE